MRGVDGRHMAPRVRRSEILDAVQRGQGLTRDFIRMPPEGREAQAAGAVVAVCSGLVRQIADNLQLDQSLLATRADIAHLICAEPSRLDHSWRRTLAGDPLQRLITGQVAAAFGHDGTLVLEERSQRPVPLPGDAASS